jgi:hypothetical protein
VSVVGKGHSGALRRLLAPSNEKLCSPSWRSTADEAVGATNFRSFCLNMFISQATIRLVCLTAGLSCSYDREP